MMLQNLRKEVMGNSFHRLLLRQDFCFQKAFYRAGRSFQAQVPPLNIRFGVYRFPGKFETHTLLDGLELCRRR